jgi:3-methyladenine DNA glycosylase AlkD
VSTARVLVARLRSLRRAENIAGQQRFGIRTENEHLGISVATLRDLARAHRRNHALALELWDSGIQEARMLAAIIDDPRQVTPAQMERWARASDNWALTDALGFGLFDRTPYAEKKAHAWSARKPEFLKRAGFALMAGMAVHRKEEHDEVFLRFLPVITLRKINSKAARWIASDALRELARR